AETDDGTVIVFNDYNRTNIIVDEATRTVVAIDPGAYVNERVHPSQSLIMGAFSITRATLRCRQNPMRSLRYYIEGYVEGSGKTSRPPIGPGIRYLMSRFLHGRSHAPLRRPAA